MHGLWSDCGSKGKQDDAHSDPAVQIANRCAIISTMQTFVPYDDVHRIASVLDRRRLNKQRIEAFQVLRAITDPTYGWQRHPAVHMWRGHGGALRLYGLAMCDEWLAQDGADNTDLRGRIAAFQFDHADFPAWWGDDRVHQSHRSNLLYKQPEYYADFWHEDKMPYFWPSKHPEYAVVMTA